MSTTTASMRRAKRWIEESRETAAIGGQTISATAEALFAHLIGCSSCELREYMDPELCAVAEAILDGPQDDDDEDDFEAWLMSAPSTEQRGEPTP